MIGNALVRRYALSALRPRYLWLNIGMYVIGLALIGLLNALALKSGTAYNGSTRLCLRSIYGQLLALQFLLLWVWGGYNTGNALREEILHKSYDFFQLLPLRPWQKLFGLVVGRNLLALALAGITAIAQLALGLASRVPLFLQLQLAFALGVTTALIWCVLTLSSIRPFQGKSRQNEVWALMLIFPAFVVVPMVIQVVQMVASGNALADWRISFFSLNFPGVLLVGIITSYFVSWAALGTMRRLLRSDVILFSPSGAYRFLAGCLVI
ncbi:MAG: hypothetical protein U1E27_07300, partial [Kiritimatiellia bacterium]|nr:hypothetical protein [Kiritimatiellia bacterium]